MKTKKKKAAKKVLNPGIKKKVGGRRAGAGRHPFKPTDAQQLQVKLLMGLGLTYREISSVIINPKTSKGVSVTTLQKHFTAELEDGGAFVKAQVTQSLFRKAISNKHPQAASCAMFIAKCRFGWRQEDKIIHEVETTGVLVAPASVSPEEWIREQQLLNAKKEPPKMSGNGNGRDD